MNHITSKLSAFERTLKHDRQIVVYGLLLIIAFCWIYILTGAGMAMSNTVNSGNMTSIEMTWTPNYFLLMLTMWWVMMAAMMLPSAAPMILLFAAISRKNAMKGHPAIPTSLFAAGYSITWGAFSLAAVMLQWGLDVLTLLTPMMTVTSTPFGAAILIAAGIYQMTPFKHACLRHCRTPIQFLAQKWRRGPTGAMRMGIEHGIFCLGCCWVLMGLLFYGGIMNLLWISMIALYVLLEKLIPAGHWLGRFSGVVLIGWGITLLLQR